MNKRELAAEAYVRSMRTGEFPAAEEASKVLAPDVKLNGAPVFGKGPTTVEGHDNVLHRISGEWPNTPVYKKGFWSEPKQEGDKVKVSATFPAMGAAPAAVNLTFSFNGQDQISQVDQEIVPQPRPEPTDTIPDSARGLINGALHNNTPITVAYVDDNGMPHMSLRGSTHVHSPTELAIWARSKDSGLATAIEKNPNIGMLYRDSNTRSTLVVQGRARKARDAEESEQVWNAIQDVEQKHETYESGCAVIIEVLSMGGGTPKGGVRVQRQG